MIKKKSNENYALSKKIKESYKKKLNLKLEI